MYNNHIISVIVENKFGVLSRISGLFSARGFNVVSLSVGETEDPTISRMTIVVSADDKILEQIKKQLNKLIDTIKIQDFTDKKYIDRELALMKVNYNKNNRTDLFQIIEVFKGNIIDMNNKLLTFEISTQTDILENLIDLLKPFGITEIVRSGKIAISKDRKSE